MVARIGEITLFQEINQGANHYCDIWVLKMDHEERICRIRLPPHASIAWPLGFSTNGDLVHMVINDYPVNPILAQYVLLLDRLQNHTTQLSFDCWYVDAKRVWLYSMKSELSWVFLDCIVLKNVVKKSVFDLHFFLFSVNTDTYEDNPTFIELIVNSHCILFMLFI